MVCIKVSTSLLPPQKQSLPFFLARHVLPPLKSANCPYLPISGNPPSISMLVFCEPPPPSTLKIQFFSEPLNILKFFILNTILSFKSGQILKFSQFQFLLMTQKILQILMYFLCENCNPSLKVEALSSPPNPFLNIWLEVQPQFPSQQKDQPSFAYFFLYMYSPLFLEYKIDVITVFLSKLDHRSLLLFNYIY